MQVSSPLLALLQSSLGTGSELEIPDASLLVVDKLPMPLGTGSPIQSQDLRGKYGSFLQGAVINQGASSGPTTFLVCTFDRGVYKITASMMSVTLSGPTPSSGSIKAARCYIQPPSATFAADIMQTYLLTGEGNKDRTELVIQFPLAGFTMTVATAVASGVGQSMGVEATFYISRVL